MDPAGNCQHLGRDLHRLRKVPGYVAERREEEVPETVSLQSPAGGEAVLEEAAQQGLVPGKRHHAVANVPGRQYVEFTAQAPELPPSSVTVTMAVMSIAGQAPSADAVACGRNPRNRVESPLPPPMATSRSGFRDAAPSWKSRAATGCRWANSAKSGRCAPGRDCGGRSR